MTAVLDEATTTTVCVWCCEPIPATGCGRTIGIGAGPMHLPCAHAWAVGHNEERRRHRAERLRTRPALERADCSICGKAWVLPVGGPGRLCTCEQTVVGGRL